ncbi:helix-turn-helix domain-containing protein [Nocardioides sp. NPDC127514]|jgi:sugar-specific transcriptional regulator TrmB/DNA-binding CsgD family transcriptional regulator|uniref:helix-turn-helix domain-containing protein n=2 Tax=Nocardioides TaxID=1839 RepID=UPI00135C576C
MLDALGLDNLEETVYRQLVAAPSANLEELAEAADLDTYAVSAVLSALEGKGLVARASAGQDRYVASPPAVALGALLVQRQDELRRAQVEMTELAGLYRGSVARRDVADVVDVVHGTEAIAQRFAQLQYSAKKCIQALQKPQAAVVTREDADEAERAAIERGVRHDIVLERSVFDTPGIYETIDSGLEIGIELRVVPTVPLRAFIVDREIALIPLMNGEHNTVQDALLLHPSGLLDAIIALFDLIWTSAPKLVATPEGTVETAADRLEPLDTKVLSLLLAGLTDASIGAQLGLSLRTVQRRVRQMMDRAQVDTRLQLGYEAGRRGWL